MTAPVTYYSTSYTRPFTTAEAEAIRAEDDTPPSWWRPMPTSVAEGFRRRCDPCDVTWNAPNNHRLDACWCCGELA